MQRLETRIRVRGASPSVASRPSRPSRPGVDRGFARDTRTRVADIFVEENTGITTLQTVLLFVGGGAGIALGVAVPSFYSNASDASGNKPTQVVLPSSSLSLSLLFSSLLSSADLRVSGEVLMKLLVKRG